MAIDYSDYMSSMTASTLPSEEEIKKRYLTAVETNKAKNTAEAEAEKQSIQDEINALSKKYQPLSNEAYLTAAKTNRQNAENLANMGLSAAGGTSQTLKNRLDTELINSIQSINLKKSEEQAEKEKEIKEIDAATAAKNAEYEQEASEDMADELKKAKERIYSIALTLLNKKYITKKQFEEMTGLKITSASAGSSSSSSKKTSSGNTSVSNVNLNDMARQGVLDAVNAIVSSR
ncbi:MAG: hypothetical protein R2876_01985 [Eubacteriales bacterium]